MGLLTFTAQSLHESHHVSASRSFQPELPVNNNNNGHFYGAWSLARSRAQCAVQKAAENCINTYNGQNKKGFRPYDRQPRKNLHTAVSVNKPKLSVTKHDQTLILAHMYNTSRYTANTKMYSGILHTHAHTHTQVGGGGGGRDINYMQIWRMSLQRGLAGAAKHRFR